MTDENQAQRRALAIRRIEAKRGLAIDAFAYLVVNGLCLVIWLFTGHGFFWPIFLLALWGMGLAIHVYTVYYGDGYTESQIQREMEKLPKDVIGPPQPS